MMSKYAIAGGLLLTILQCGCVAPEVGRAEDFGVTRQREWDDLNQLKGDVRWNQDAPRVFRFPGHGNVTVRVWYLEGGPGWEYVRAKFTYQNTTDQYMEGVDVELEVMDGEGNFVSASRVRLNHPWGLTLAPTTFFSDEIVVPTEGAHLSAGGWQWTIKCVGVPERPV